MGDSGENSVLDYLLILLIHLHPNACMHALITHKKILVNVTV